MAQVKVGGLQVPSYYVGPRQSTAIGGVLLIHEVWGLNDHIKSVADRLARADFEVLAPDLLMGTPLASVISPQLEIDMADPALRPAAQLKLRAAFSSVDLAEFNRIVMERLSQCFEFLFARPGVQERVACVGFCIGGTLAFSLAASEPRLKAVAPFYGRPPANLESLRSISCPVLAFYGELDADLISKLPDLQSAMDGFRKEFTSLVYPDCGHAFFNDSNSATYNPHAAQMAWKRLIPFLKKNLKPSG